jgi:hypothetical protein
MSEENNIPEQVIDKEAYEKYQKYVNLPSITLPGRLIETSDIHTTIDPFTKRDIIEKDIIHLPEDEQQDIIKKVKARCRIQEEMITLRTKAYGLKRDYTSLSDERIKMILDERSAEILEYYGRYYENGDILKIINVEWGYNINEKSLNNFKKKNTEKIKRIQESYRKDLNGSKLYHKRYRLEELAELYRGRKENYQKTNAREDVKIMASILKQAREEAEANEINIKGEFTHNVELSINQHLEKEVQLDLVLKEIILARVSHRLGVNPAYLLNRLRNSVYASFTGFASPQGALYDQEIVYPSTMVYNWKEIEKAQKKEYTQFEEVKEAEKDKLGSLKEELKAKLERKKSAIGKIKNRIENREE